jgi:aspartyl/asparaginyl beta-hydroxylase (cupin superfamily)
MHETVIRDLLGESYARALQASAVPIDVLLLQAYQATEREFGTADLRRLGGFFASALSGSQRALAVADPRQQPLVAYFPGLRATPFWSPLDSDLVAEIATQLARSWRTVRGELCDVFTSRPDIFSTNPTGMRYPSLAADDWTVCNLFVSGQLTDAAPAFTHTTALIERLADSIAPGGKVGFIQLKARARLPMHSDATNAQLTCHLPLIVPVGCGLRVAGEERSWQEGEPLFFDHCYPHEAWNDSDSTRIMLLLNLVHPDLRPDELAAWRRFYEHLLDAAARSLESA